MSDLSFGKAVRYARSLQQSIEDKQNAILQMQSEIQEVKSTQTKLAGLMKKVWSAELNHLAEIEQKAKKIVAQ